MSKIVIHRIPKNKALIFSGSINEAFSLGHISQKEMEDIKSLMSDSVENFYGKEFIIDSVEIFDGFNDESVFTVEPLKIVKE